MAKLSKRAAELHLRAAELAASDRRLTEDEKEFVLDHWQESATTHHALDGAFFTPRMLARDFSIHVAGDRIIDLGAGIGHLAFGCRDLLRRWNGEPVREFVCVERNPDYVAVGRKVLPEATWICANMFDVPAMGLGTFDRAISNPPFGFVATTRPGRRYRGRRAEYRVIELASRIARAGTFIIPQDSAPFRYSGRQGFEEHRTSEYLAFESTTGITLRHNCGIDTSFHARDWRGVSPTVEIVLCNFDDERQVDDPELDAIGRESRRDQVSLPRVDRRPAARIKANRARGSDQLTLFTEPT